MNSILLSIAKFTALEVFHNRLLWLIAAGAFTSIGLGFFGHALAITESLEIQIAFMSFSLRIIAVFIVCLIVVNSISKELNDKNLDMLLSLSITRASYYFGKLAGFSFIVLFIVIVFGLCMLIAAEPPQVLIWSISLFCELFLVLCFSFLCALSLKQMPVAIFIVVAFYLLSRSIGAAVLMMNAPLLSVDSFSNSVMLFVLQGVSFLIPDFSYFTQSDWLIYNNAEWGMLSGILFQTASYFIFLAGASLIDFYRKNI